MRIAITGNIASGKSLITNYLLEKKYVVIDADKIGHNVLLDEDVKKELTNIFSNSILTNNIIDRKKLGEIVFDNEEKLKLLNEITHPKIKNIIEKNFSELGNELVFLDIALLFECGFQDLVDKIMVVYVDSKTQLTRLMKRNNFTKEDALKRINSQMPSIEKIKLADFIINNNGSKEETFSQIEVVLEKLKVEGTV